jgi:hypothetical protein
MSSPLELEAVGRLGMTTVVAAELASPTQPGSPAPRIAQGDNEFKEMKLGQPNLKRG